MCGAVYAALVWLSKNSRYEKPYCVTGAVKPTGPEQAPKGIDVKIGLLEQGKVSGSSFGIGGRNI
jgi:hypothetical protein